MVLLRVYVIDADLSHWNKVNYLTIVFSENEKLKLYKYR